MSGSRSGAKGKTRQRSGQILAAAAAGLGLLALAALPAASAAPADPAPLRAGTTSLRFEAEIFADLGIALVDVAVTGAPLRDGALGFALDASASSVRFDARGSDFEGFAAADLRHTGGFTWLREGARIDLAGFRLVETPAPYTLALHDAQGRRWLLVDKPHALLSAEALSLRSADLLITPELALWLGRSDLAGTYVGTLDMQLELAASEAAAGAALLGGCVADFTQPIDLLMLSMSGMTQAAREPGVRVAMAPSATVRNLGPGDVQWFRAIAPADMFGPLGPHPYLALHFYRLAGGVLEQIGRADLKHTFFATNSGCGCPGDQVLYVNCEDLYGAGTNFDRANLAPRSEIDARTLAWSSLGSHFDGIPVDDFRDHEGNEDHDAFQHRLVVREPDLQTPGAQYFYDGWYMAPNDTNLVNSMGHRKVNPVFGGSTWTFAALDSGVANGSILDVLVDPQNVQPGQATELLDTGAGRVHLAAVTSDLGGGNFHYEYALMNFDVERQIRSFSVSLGPGQTVSNAGFGDANGNALDDWTASVANGRLTWTASVGNALDWGTLYNFRMNVNAAPLETRLELLPLDPGTPAAFAVRSLPEPDAGASLASALAALALLARRRAGRKQR